MNVSEADIAGIMGALEELRAAARGDFIALAVLDPDGATMRWPYAVGNRSQRYRRIALRAGQDVAGLALRLNRRVVLQGGAETARQRSQSPIMLAEGLLAAAALPLPSRTRPPGVLLVGSRAERLFTDGELALFEAAAGKLSGYLPV